MYVLRCTVAFTSCISSGEYFSLGLPCLAWAVVSILSVYVFMKTFSSHITDQLLYNVYVLSKSQGISSNTKGKVWAKERTRKIKHTTCHNAVSQSVMGNIEHFLQFVTPKKTQHRNTDKTSNQQDVVRVIVLKSTEYQSN